ncbi:MAG: nucleotidyltransferase domain-containing protein [Nitrospinae bacterium]|nr:nucleotidyltransferase domain-containing protein [Nitrospinota bacterium]
MITLVEEKLDAVRELCGKYRVRRLELFGSAVEGAFGPESDLDFLVEFQPGTNLGPWLSLYQDLQSDLEGIFGRKVDLVMEKALKNPYFIRRVNRSRQLIYEG